MEKKEIINTPIMKFESSAEEFMEKFGVMSRLEEVLRRDDTENMPLVLTANLGIFAVIVAILLVESGNSVSATSVILLVATVISCLTIPLNIWFIARVKMREYRFKKEREKIQTQTKGLIIKVFDLFTSVINEKVETQTNLFLKLHQVNKESIKEFGRTVLKEKDDVLSEVLASKGIFIFDLLNELSFYKAIYQYNKCLDSTLDEKWPRIKLYIDRLSNYMKYYGLGVNVVLVLCALLIATLI